VGVLIYLQSVALINFGQFSRPLQAVLPHGLWKNFLGLGRDFPQDRLFAAVAAAILAAAIWALWRFTRFGLATRAAAENEKGAVLLGYSPVRLAAVSWIMASVLAGLTGFLIGPIAGQISPSRYTLFIVPALGAALIGSLSSVPWTTAGGLLLGSLASVVVYLSQQSWFPHWAQSGVGDAIPLVVVAAVLFLRGDRLPERGTVEERRLPAAPRPVRVAPWTVIAIGAGLIASNIFTGPWQFAFTTSMIAAILMLSYVVITGYVGQISLAQLALAGTGAFVMVRMMSNGHIDKIHPFAVHGPGVPMIVALPVGVLAAVAIGLIVGLPALRIRGVQLAVVTIAAALTLQSFYFQNPKLTDLRAGSGAPVPKPKLFGLDLSVASKRGLSDRITFNVFVIVMLAICALIVTNLRRGTSGRRFLAVRANERAAAAAGINVERTKMLAFAYASGLAGVAGIMFAYQQGNISSANWELYAGLGFLAFAYLGGISSVNGALVGGLLTASGLWAFFLQFHFHGIDKYITMIGGVGLILTAILNPEGIGPTMQPMFRALGNALVHWRGREWLRAARRLGPAAVIGGVAGWLIWTRQSRYSWWMVLLGIGIALFVRSVALQVWMAVRHETPAFGVSPAEPHTPAEADGVGVAGEKSVAAARSTPVAPG
jgi:branched-chain amino acid transport system permease protein